MAANTDHMWPLFTMETHREEPTLLESVVTSSCSRRHLTTQTAPLRRGYGTHIGYLWVGTPAQRVSVILDTGSHQLAFPCSGCKNCGHHIDPYWDLDLSNTASVDSCFGIKRCTLEQSYTEGSSWRAFTLTDVVRLGGDTAPPSLLRNDTVSTVRFGCQSSITGLFRTQLANGIMGLSGSAGTLPSVMYESKVILEETFGLCFRRNGGIMTVGGVDPGLFTDRIEPNDVIGGNSPPAVSAVVFALPSQQAAETFRLPLFPRSSAGPIDAGAIAWARLVRQRGWFTVRVLGIMMTDNHRPHNETSSVDLHSVRASSQQLNSGKGAILDSGTTDTFLPRVLAENFRRLFQELTGIPFKNRIVLSPKQLATLPDIIFRLRGFSATDISKYMVRTSRSSHTKSASFYDEPTHAVDVMMKSSDYVHHIKGDEYSLNIYLTEPDGLVLGANFMNQKYILFDRNSRRVGFATSPCVQSSLDSQVAATSPKEDLLNKSNKLRGSPGIETSGAINSSDKEYWRLIGWRRRTSDAPKGFPQAPTRITYARRRLSDVDRGQLQKKDPVLRKSLLGVCNQMKGAPSPKETAPREGRTVVVGVVPLSPCSATCLMSHSKPDGTGGVYATYGKQPWQCVFRTMTNSSGHSQEAIISHRTSVMEIHCAVKCYRNQASVAAKRGSKCLSDAVDTTVRTTVGASSNSVQFGSWSLCSSSCIQSRIMISDSASANQNLSVPTFNERECFNALCPESIISPRNHSILFQVQFLSLGSAGSLKVVTSTLLDELTESFSRVLQVPEVLLSSSANSNCLSTCSSRADRRYSGHTSKGKTMSLFVRLRMPHGCRSVFYKEKTAKYYNRDSVLMSENEFIGYVRKLIIDQIFSQTFKSDMIRSLQRSRSVVVHVPDSVTPFDSTDAFDAKAWREITYWNWVRQSYVNVRIVSEFEFSAEVVTNPWVESVSTSVLGEELGHDIAQAESVQAILSSLFVLILSLVVVCVLRCNLRGRNS